MITAALLTAVVWLLIAGCGPGLARRLPPAVAVRLLVSCGVVVAASTLAVGAMVAFTWIAQLPEVIEFGPWSGAVLRASAPVSWVVAVGCAVAVAAGAAHGALVAAGRLRSIWAVRRACADLAVADGLVVLTSDSPEAFSTPPPNGRVVVSTALLRGLTVAQRRAVLAHETSHLTHGHVWWVLVADMAAAVNPLLRPNAHVVDLAVERWADEDAAIQVADRRLVARTLATTALLTRETRARRAALAAATGSVPHRVAALLDPAPRIRAVPVALLAALLLASGVGSALVQRRADDLLDHAQIPVVARHSGDQHSRSR